MNYARRNQFNTTIALAISAAIHIVLLLAAFVVGFAMLKIPVIKKHVTPDIQLVPSPVAFGDIRTDVTGGTGGIPTSERDLPPHPVGVEKPEVVSRQFNLPASAQEPVTPKQLTLPKVVPPKEPFVLDPSPSDHYAPSPEDYAYHSPFGSDSDVGAPLGGEEMHGAGTGDGNGEGEGVGVGMRGGSGEGADVVALAKPHYPYMARRLGQSGVVVVTATIMVDGKPTKVRILNSSGYDDLDAAALKAVREARFTPAHIKGEPEAGEIHIEFTFTLNDSGH